MPELVLIRGLPGSGKSTLARTMTATHRHFEADMFFVGKTFDGRLLNQAHGWCQSITEKALLDGNNVVVSNTFVRRWELEPYLFIANRAGATVRIIECNGEWQNIHGVPETTIDRMRRNWESI